MRFKKKSVPVEASRKIPEADISGFESPDLVKVKPLQQSDKDLLKALTKELRITGVIERTPVDTGRQTLQELGEIFSEAEKHQKYEKDINPDFYDHTADTFLIDRENMEGDIFANPSLDSIDYYEEDVYDKTILMSDSSLPSSLGEDFLKEK